MAVVTNIAAYKFAPLTELKVLREDLQERCKTWQLRGTILLSTEGINLFIAGDKPKIEELLTLLRNIKGLESLEVKYSESDTQPFHRMLVKIKKEIIAFGIEGIDPASKPAPAISPKQLKEWLDAGKPVVMLDTRNDYEVKLGTFHSALPIGIDHFRDFPEAVKNLPEAMKKQPIVTFCTGGIRCEKAAPYLQQQGFEEVYQLSGGILKYFEECGNAHYQGDCFVFDQRTGLDPSLHESDIKQCFVCQAPLNFQEQADPRYIENTSCPICFKSDEEKLSVRLAERSLAMKQVTTPLPGSSPYDHDKPLKITLVHDKKTILEFLVIVFDHIDPEEWLNRFAQGRILDQQRHLVPPDHIVRAGEVYIHRNPAQSEPDVSTNITFLHEDEALIVLNKPAPLPVHPCGRFNFNTLQSFLQQVYKPLKPRPAHRLDANTTGVMVFTKMAKFAGLVQPQFANGLVRKTYLARVQGEPATESFRCDLAIGNEPTDLGGRDVVTSKGLPALTEFRVVHRFADKTTLLEVNPKTGRTNQIRVHLWALGMPIVGEQTYLPGGVLGDAQTHAVGDPPLCLHAWKIEFTHPLLKKQVDYNAPPPDWANEVGT